MMEASSIHPPLLPGPVTLYELEHIVIVFYCILSHTHTNILWVTLIRIRFAEDDISRALQTQFSCHIKRERSTDTSLSPHSRVDFFALGPLSMVSALMRGFSAIRFRIVLCQNGHKSGRISPEIYEISFVAVLPNFALFSVCSFRFCITKRRCLCSLSSRVSAVCLGPAAGAGRVEIKSDHVQCVLQHINEKFMGIYVQHFTSMLDMMSTTIKITKQFQLAFTKTQTHAHTHTLHKDISHTTTLRFYYKAFRCKSHAIDRISVHSSAMPRWSKQIPFFKM